MVVLVSSVLMLVDLYLSCANVVTSYFDLNEVVKIPDNDNERRRSTIYHVILEIFHPLIAVTPTILLVLPLPLRHPFMFSCNLSLLYHLSNSESNIINVNEEISSFHTKVKLLIWISTKDEKFSLPYRRIGLETPTT
jgi:hypothetical protein